MERGFKRASRRLLDRGVWGVVSGGAGEGRPHETGRRAHRFAGFGLVIGAMAALLGCSVTAKTGDPALPPGFEERGIPDVDVNGLVYVSTGHTLLVSLGAFGDVDDAKGAAAVSIESVVREPEREYAGRIEFADEATAQAVAELALEAAGDAAARWVQVERRFVSIGRSDVAWGDDIRAAWAGDKRVPLADRYPEVWDTLRLLPEAPPSPPVAVGFGRNVAAVLDSTLDATGVSLPGLSSAFALVRADVAVFAAYAEGLPELPEQITRELLRDSNVGIIAVAEAGYPGFVVSFLFDLFVERAGLAEVDVGDTTAHYRAIDDDLHLMVKAYGSSIFLTLASSKPGAEDLVRAVVSSQESRS